MPAIPPIRLHWRWSKFICQQHLPSLKLFAPPRHPSKPPLLPDLPIWPAYPLQLIDDMQFFFQIPDKSTEYARLLP